MAIAAGVRHSLALVAVPEPGFRITRIAWSSEERGIRLEWTSVAGKTYAVERSAGGVTGPYQPVARGIQATPPSNVNTEPVPPAAAPRFYRIRVEP